MPIGGGQDLLARMKDYIDSPDRLVNVKRLDATITSTPDGGMKIGSAVKIVDLVEHAQVAKLYPAINAAAIEIGTPQIRNQGTVGGNVNQRPRCWYYRNEEFVCFKKGGSRCFAVNGENQYHAIFGNEGPSHIVHPSSLAVPFVAYGAKFRVLGPNGEREIAAADYFTLPTLQNVLKENVLDDEDILTHVILPAPGNVKHGHYEVRYKAVARLAARLHHRGVDDERQHDSARRAWCSARSRRSRGDRRPPKPRWPASRSTSRPPPRPEKPRSREAKPMSGNAYKVQIAKTAVKRAVMRAAGNQDGRESDGYQRYGPSDIAEVDARRALSEPPAQGNVRHVGPGSRRVHVLRQVRLDGVLVRGDAARLRPRRRAGASRLLLE